VVAVVSGVERVSFRPYLEQEDCIPEILDLSSLGQWLEQMHLLQYKPIMLRHGCVTAEQIMRLTKRYLQIFVHFTEAVRFY